MTSAAPTTQPDSDEIAAEAIDRLELSVDPAARRGFFAVHDIIMLVYLGLMRGLLYMTAPEASVGRRLELSLVVLLTGCIVRALPSDTWGARIGHAWRRRIQGTVYRLALVFVVAQSYLILRELLPILNTGSLDAELLAIDEALFGVTPALVLERLNTRPIIEWFSFFYFSYFILCAGYTASALWLVRDRQVMSVYAIGCTIVLFVGQTLYVAVPGFGPIRYLASSFAGPLDGGFFWGLVIGTVERGGAMKDIFPSLHTALPTWFTLFAFHAASVDKRWRIPAYVTGFFAVNIVFSTMLLRWHYAIDVVAGLVLAFSAAAIARWAAPLEARYRHRQGLLSPWP
ncbi:MAG: phosphatase PAP2 family protein [Polyangiaceae bacterium]